MASSSFVKRTRLPDGTATASAPQFIEAPGVRPSLHNSWPVMSSGLADWDEALSSDGFPLGSVICLQEDEPTQYYKAFADYFVAEGVAQGHILGIAVADEDPGQAWGALPRRRVEVEEPTPTANGEDSSDSRNDDKDIRIAWRYRGSGTVQQQREEQKRRLSKFCHRYDLSRKHEMLPNEAAPGTVLLLGVDPTNDDSLSVVCDQLEVHLKACKSLRKPARVVIRSWHLPAWAGGIAPRLQSLRRIRSLARDYMSVVMITCAMSAADPRFEAALYHWSDIVLQVDSFQGHGAAVAGLGDYLGVMRIHKYGALGSGLMRPPRLDTRLFSFKRGRRKYIMDPAHSAPDEEVTSFETGKRLVATASGVPDF